MKVSSQHYFLSFYMGRFFLPLFLNFGLLEFFGALCIKIMRPLFKLPGRSAMDALASWLGDGTIGNTSNQSTIRGRFLYKKRGCHCRNNLFHCIHHVQFSRGLYRWFRSYVCTFLFNYILGLLAAIIMPRTLHYQKRK